MLNDNAKKWVAALRSGKYEQAKGWLREGDKFCCLGVACDLFDPDEWHHRAAVAAVKQDRFFLIPTRDRDGPYLLRMWLSPPLLTMKGDRASTP